MKTQRKTKSSARKNSSPSLTKSETHTITTWAEARKLKIHRISPFGSREKLDPGINFFVLMLEKLGAVTFFSCEGHPDGFYVLFAAPIELVQRLVLMGWFSYELEGGVAEVNGQLWPRWSVRRNFDDEKNKQLCLKWAAEAWAAKFGAINVVAERVTNKTKKFT